MALRKGHVLIVRKDISRIIQNMTIYPAPREMLSIKMDCLLKYLEQTAYGVST